MISLVLTKIRNNCQSVRWLPASLHNGGKDTLCLKEERRQLTSLQMVSTHAAALSSTLLAFFNLSVADYELAFAEVREVVDIPVVMAVEEREDESADKVA